MAFQHLISRIIKDAPGVVLEDDPEQQIYPTPADLSEE